MNNQLISNLSVDSETVEVEMAQLDDSECPICFFNIDPINKIQLASCGHEFHSGCILTWNNVSPDPRCPICREPMNLPKNDSKKIVYNVLANSQSILLFFIYLKIFFALLSLMFVDIATLIIICMCIFTHLLQICLILLNRFTRTRFLQGVVLDKTHLSYYLCLLLMFDLLLGFSILRVLFIPLKYICFLEFTQLHIFLYYRTWFKICYVVLVFCQMHVDMFICIVTVDIVQMIGDYNYLLEQNALILL